MFPWDPLEITIRNMVPSRIFSLGTLFLTVISRETKETIFYCTFFYRETAANSQENMVPQGSPGNICKK
jgi:hypothetical protein